MERYRSTSSKALVPRTFMEDTASFNRRSNNGAWKTPDVSVGRSGRFALGRGRIVTVEPLVFLFMFGLFLMIFIEQQYFFWHYGMAALAASHNRTSRNHCVSARELESSGRSVVHVQESSSRLLSYVNVPGQLLCIATSMVLGPLSDTLGRKFIFYSAGTGVILQGLLSFFIVWFELDLHFFILSGSLTGLFGGFASTLGASFAYTADISSPGPSRTVRIAVVEAMVFVAGVVSQGGAGKLLELLDCSFWPLTVIFTGSGLLMILYTAVFLPEPFSRQERLQRSEEQPKGAGRALRGLKLFFCPSSYSTWKLWASLTVLIIIIGNLVGTQMITAIFQEGHPLKWTPSMIGYFDVVLMAAHGFASIVILPLLVALSLPDVVSALIGVLFSCGMSLFTGFVRHSWQMFLVGTVSGMEAIVAPSTRSLMSKLVSAGDQGALFTFVLSMELLVAALATAFYTNIFPVLLSHHLRPGSVYFIMAAFCIVPLVFLLILWARSYHSHTWLCCKQRSSHPQMSNSLRAPLSVESEDETTEDEEPLLYNRRLLQTNIQTKSSGHYSVY